MSEADEGLQAERTVLAWRRTQLALTLVACLALRGLPQEGRMAMATLFLSLLVAHLICSGKQRCYARCRDGLAGRRASASVAATASLALGVAAIAAAGMTAILLP
ncbi:DUF202 domain-containing protein [Pseudomonas sp. LFM046]|uniref:DUF202 domain-containing protein n=1 Tax=Pseudomonas sp. LFM046 TaxID=1608357 RepID=UPI0005CFAB41|nr:DUF202 domain-containing protein [Pseudomonas sp. LFM046]